MASRCNRAELVPSAELERFRSLRCRGHRIRLQVAGGAFPRFSRNPGNGQLDATAADLVPTHYDIGLDAAHPSALLLPVAAGGANPGSTAPARRA